MTISHDMKDFNLAVNTHVDRRRPACIDVGTQRQLLFDDFFVALGARPDQYPHGIRWVNASVERHGAPLFQGESPWEKSSAWACVLKDGGLYRMWYNSGHEGLRGLRVSYAQSDDGLHFQRRPLGLVEHAGSTANNIVFDGGHQGVSPELGNVFVDPEAPPSERYKMLYSDWGEPTVFDLPFTHNVGMLRGAASPDGLHWRRYHDNFTGRYCDSQNVACWDADLGRFVAYHRTSGSYGGLAAGDLRVDAEGRGRAVGRLESRDYRDWVSTGVALQADFADGLGVDVYNSAYCHYPGAAHAHFMFPSFYNHHAGTFDVMVCTSRDNRHWFRPTRQPFIARGARPGFDCFIISVAPGLVPLDADRFALYYRSGNGPHGGSAVLLDEQEKRQVASRVSRVVLRRDRIVGIEAGAEWGHFATRPLRVGGRRLLLNVEPTGPAAELRAQVLSTADDQAMPGLGFDDCQPLHTDDLDAVVRWQGGDQLGPASSGALVRLHLRFRQMRVYAFQFSR